ncbi:MAG: hypothetical protein J5720_08505 [Bacteroidaceae bacterium]|nr:hypothetical protein [Bacteroidaceae bacterium]
MNYSCLPNDDGSLKGTTRMSTTVGMDIDHIADNELEAVKDNILAKAAELGLLMLEGSARGKGYHLVFRRHPELSQEENLKWASELLGVPYDEGAKDITRVFFTTTNNELFYLDPEIFKIEQTPSVPKDISPSKGRKTDSSTAKRSPSSNLEEEREYPSEYHGVPYSKIVEAWLGGKKVKEGDRHRTSLYLADHLRYITENDAGLIEKILRETPFVQEIIEERGENVAQTVKSAQGFDFYKNIPKKMQEALRKVGALDDDSLPYSGELEEDTLPIEGESEGVCLPKMPQGVKDSIEAVGPQLAMPVVTAICPCIGALATGVVLDVHGRKRGLNLIAYIAGDFASGKGDIDPVVDAWMSEVAAVDKMYLQQEEEFRTKKQAAKNKKEQPEEPKLPIRYVTLNTTVAKLAERLANTEGKHAYSFTPEADTVAQKLKTAISDFSVMLRESYDGSKFDREAKSLEAVNVHIEHLLWNVTMCGTPDALYRVVRNYTDGFQSRIAVARTPDNTFSPLEDKPHVLTERQSDRIQQVAHLLPLMYGEVVLPKLEAKGREWLEVNRLETMKNDDRIKARQRFRVCVTAQRMTCCIMLCKVCETLIQKHGLNGAESRLKSHPNLWKELLLKAQTPQMLEAFDVIADSLMENALHFFRDRIENAFTSRDYAGSNDRQRIGKNDSIYERLDVEFSFEQAMQHSIAIKGAGVTHNTVQQMLKNWKRQGLVSKTDVNRYRKMAVECH